MEKKKSHGDPEKRKKKPELKLFRSDIKRERRILRILGFVSREETEREKESGKRKTKRNEKNFRGPDSRFCDA